MEFAYDGGGLGKGGEVTLYVDGKSAGSGRVERTHYTLFTFDETTDVGRDTGSPVIADYPARGNAYSGRIRWIRIDLGDDSQEHLIPPEEHFKVAMTRQ
jgi:hypothetical protein